VGSLTEDQKSVVIGALLGDGYMSCKTNAYLKIGHSIKQKEYVNWKYQYLSEFVIQPPSQYQGNGSRVGYRFWTRSLPIFTSFYRSFYDEMGKKIIPSQLSITPLALAVWYMDDGAKNRTGAYFNTQQFNFDSQQILIQILSKQFDLQGKLNRDKKYLRIRLTKDSGQKLKKIIAPIMPNCMFYKLPL